MRGNGYRTGHMGALSLNPAARRIGSPFITSREVPQGVTEALDLRTVGVLTQSDLGNNPDLYAARPMLPEAQSGSATVRNELQYSNFNNVPLSIGAASQKVLLKPASNSRRVYLFIVNTHGAQIMYMAFGQDASALVGVPIPALNGSFEFNNIVPQDDVFIIANGAGTSGVMLYSNDNLIGGQ